MWIYIDKEPEVGTACFFFLNLEKGPVHYAARAAIWKKAITKCSTLKIDFI